jgi:tRNA pseudouridine55 synthase
VTQAWDGLLLIDKPAGPTSHDIVASVRRATGGARVGHTGTLDPPATGLLVLVLGCATRLARFLPSEPKTYAGEFVLGVTTTTDDLAGEATSRHDGPIPSAHQVVLAASERIGRQMQVPPSVSAKHVAGKRLYALARRGKPVTAAAAEVVVDRFTVTPTSQADTWGYEMVVSSGTYVRAAVRDLGEALGCGGAVASLRRTAVGPLRVEDAIAWPADRASLRAAAVGGLIVADAMPLAMPDVTLDAEEPRRRFAAGVAIPWPGNPPPVLPAVAVRAPSGALLGVGSVDEGMLRPKVVLPARTEPRPILARPQGL